MALCVALGAQKACPGSRRAGFQGLDQAVRAEDLDGSLDVVAEDPQRPLASGFFQPRTRKRGRPIIHFIVPKGCSATQRLNLIHFGSAAARSCIA